MGSVTSTAKIDWLSFTDKSTWGRKPPLCFRLGDVERKNGRFGYAVSDRYQGGLEHHWHPERTDMGHHYILSGSAIAYLCKYHEDYVNELFRFAGPDAQVSRIDLAVDVYNGSSTVADYARAAADGLIETRVTTPPKIVGTLDEIETLYVGSMKKRTKLMRIYNKAKEQDVEAKWVRIELELRGRPATEAWQMLSTADKPGSWARSIIKGFCNFPQNTEFQAIMGEHAIGTPVGDKNARNRRIWLMEGPLSAMSTVLDEDPSFLELWLDALMERREQVNVALHDKHDKGAVK